MQSVKSKGCFSSSTKPDSYFEKSKISLMTVSKVSPLTRMVSVNSRCSLLSGVSNNNDVMPMTPFIGVRISWLMVAKNAVLARAAPMASLCAATMLNCCARCTLTSRNTYSTQSHLPCVNARRVRSIAKLEPSARTPTMSAGVVASAVALVAVPAVAPAGTSCVKGASCNALACAASGE